MPLDYRLATPTDHAALAAYLDANLACAMFPRANLDEFGFGGTHPYACRYWIKTQGGQVTAAIALANSGMVMPCVPPQDALRLARLLQGEQISAFTGPRDQVEALCQAFGVQNATLLTQTREPHFHLSLDALNVPDGRGEIVAFQDGPAETLLDWLTQYQREVVHQDPVTAAQEAEHTLQRNCERGLHVVLMDGATPLAMSGLNARVGPMGQVGGVFTPPELRGQGLARRIVALHLAALRTQGLREAVLYAASGPASNAYRAIGFREIGDWCYQAFEQPQVITCPD